MREFPGAQSSVQRQKAQLVNFISEDATEKEAMSLYFTGLLLQSTQNTWRIF